MIEETIYYLTKMYLEEYNKEQDKFIMTKKDLLEFCLKLMRIVRSVENG